MRRRRARDSARRGSAADRIAEAIEIGRERNDRARRERNGRERERERVGILDLRLPKHRDRLQYISCGKRP